MKFFTNWYTHLGNKPGSISGHLFAFSLILLSACSQNYDLSPLKKTSNATDSQKSTEEKPNDPDGTVQIPTDPPHPTTPGEGGPGDGGGDQYTEKTIKQSFIVSPMEKKIDMLFVVDNSGSMSNEQTILRDSFASFIAHFQTRLLSFRIGIITTDSVSTTLAGFKTGGPGSLVSYGENDRVLTNNTPNLTTQFAQNVKVGTSGDGGEMGIHTATLALSPQNTDPGKPNENFLRPDAFLSILFISDEDESTKPDRNDYVKYYSDIKKARFDAFRAALERVKPNKLGLVRTDAIVKPSGTVGPDGVDTCPTGFVVGSTYSELAPLYGGNTTSICSNFSSRLIQLGADIATQVQTQFVLEKKLHQMEQVVLNGKTLNEGTEYTYNAEANAVTIIGSAVGLLENTASSTLEISFVIRELIE